MLNLYKNKPLNVLLLALLLAASLAGCGSNQDSAATPVAVTPSDDSTLPSPTVTTTPEAAVTAESSAETTTSPATRGNPVFDGVLSGIIGSRPIDGSVHDLEKNYFKNTELFESAGHDIYTDVKFPQLKFKSEGARMFNSYMRSRAKSEAESAFEPLLSTIKHGEFTDESGWIYYDYGVVESDRYISIITANRITYFRSTNPLTHFEVYVYDKEIERIVSFQEIADGFGIDRETMVSGLENLFPDNNVELSLYERYFYEDYYRKHLSYIWNNMYDERDGRGIEERFMRHESFDDSAQVGLYVDAENELRVIYSKTELDGTNESTGNLLFRFNIQDTPYSEIPVSQRKINPIFEYYADKGAPVNDDVNAMIIRLADLDSNEFAEQASGFLSEIPTMDNVIVSRAHRTEERTIFILIPRHSAVMTLIPAQGDYPSVYKIGDAQILSVDTGDPGYAYVILESRGSHNFVDFTGEQESFDVVDITEYVKIGNTEEMVEEVKYLRQTFK